MPYKSYLDAYDLNALHPDNHITLLVTEFAHFGDVASAMTKKDHYAELRDFLLVVSANLEKARSLLPLIESEAYKKFMPELIDDIDSHVKQALPLTIEVIQSGDYTKARPETVSKYQKMIQDSAYSAFNKVKDILLRKTIKDTPENINKYKELSTIVNSLLDLLNPAVNIVELH